MTAPRRRWPWRRDQADLPAVAAPPSPQPGTDVAVRPVVAGVIMDRPDALPALPAGQVADLRAALAPHLDPRVVDLVAAVAVGATVLARQRQQGSSAAFLEAARRGVWSGPVPGPPEFRSAPGGAA